MQIIVASDHEKVLIEKFIEAIKEHEILDQVRDYVDLVAELPIDLVDFEIIEDGLKYAEIKVGLVRPLKVDSNNLQGVCCKCDKYVTGLEEEEIKYDEYLELRTLFDSEHLLCSKCLIEED